MEETDLQNAVESASASLPDMKSETREEIEAANKTVKALFDSWDDDIRLVFWCTAQGIPLTNPKVDKAFKRRKSARLNAYNSERKKLQELVRKGWVEGESFDYGLFIREVLWPMLEEWRKQADLNLE